jgi:hypothetical protein
MPIKATRDIDQKDLIARTDHLMEQTREFRVTLITCGGETVEAPKLTGLDMIVRLEVLEEHNEELMRKIGAHLLASTPQTRSIDHVEAMAAENRRLKIELGAARSTLAAHETTISEMTVKYGDFETALSRRTAEEVARLGINPKAIPQPKAGAARIPGIGGASQQAGAEGKPGDRNLTEEILQYQAEHGKTPIQKR